MDPKQKESLDGREWRRLCELVLAESDPQRISELVDQLLRELDACRAAVRKSEKLLDGDRGFESLDN